jgi:monoamine oxidase
MFKNEVALMLPHFTQSLRELRIIDWSQEKHFGACYSFPAPGSITKVMPLLRRGLGNLHFVGEHCDAGFVGYMEGALRSGLRVAETIGAGKPSIVAV